MENIKDTETGFVIEKILLIDSSFSRINHVVFDEKVENNFNINVEVGVSDSVISVSETVLFCQKFQETEQFKISAKMVGVFRVVGKTVIGNLEEFGKVNGAAIIFPYIREHITNLCVKAGIGAILLPPVNFTGK